MKPIRGPLQVAVGMLLSLSAAAQGSTASDQPARSTGPLMQPTMMPSAAFWSMICTQLQFCPCRLASSRTPLRMRSAAAFVQAS